MENSLYNKSVVCPVCNKKVEVTKVKTKDCVISSRDTDFCIYYEGINPMFYDSWVCEFCGYAALSEKFESLSKVFVNPIKNSIALNWKTRKFCGERDVDKALEAYKLALLSLSYTKPKASELAKVSIRIAWLYRIKKDEDNEMDFLRHTLNFYHEIYEKEDLPIGKLDKYTCMYMIAELSRRIEKHEDALSWFSKVLSSPEARANKLLIENARDQAILIREQRKRVKVSI